jgi:hypothetical protein
LTETGLTDGVLVLFDGAKVLFDGAKVLFDAEADGNEEGGRDCEIVLLDLIAICCGGCDAAGG